MSLSVEPTSHSQVIFISFIFNYFILCVIGVSPAYMYVYYVCAQYMQSPEESVEFPGIGVTNSIGLLYGLESNPGPLVEQLSSGFIYIHVCLFF